jgi:hypothetical protein
MPLIPACTAFTVILLSYCLLMLHALFHLFSSSFLLACNQISIKTLINQGPTVAASHFSPSPQQPTCRSRRRRSRQRVCLWIVMSTYVGGHGDRGTGRRWFGVRIDAWAGGRWSGFEPFYHVLSNACHSPCIHPSDGSTEAATRVVLTST